MVICSVAARYLSFIWVIGGLLVVSCGSVSQDEDAEGRYPGGPDFRPVLDIDFYEVRRSFDSGISYDTLGFVQRPEWHLKFAAEDSVLIYSPMEDRMLGYRMYHDHDHYFHFARESWRVVELHPDSITLQRLSLSGLRVNKIKSNVYMKFYSERHLQNLIGDQEISTAQMVEELRRPSIQDTLFVRERAETANRNPHNPDSAFASQNFARLTSNHPALSIRKKRLENIELTDQSPAYEYLYPEYVITIDPAYRRFSHDFSVVVDEEGKMRLGKVFVMKEFEEARTRVVEGIIDVYLSNWLEVEPAHTLGIPHASVVYLYVMGRAPKEGSTPDETD